jgi:hypothetical protein
VLKRKIAGVLPGTLVVPPLYVDVPGQGPFQTKDQAKYMSPGHVAFEYSSMSIPFGNYGKGRGEWGFVSEHLFLPGIHPPKSFTRHILEVCTYITIFHLNLM